MSSPSAAFTRLLRPCVAAGVCALLAACAGSPFADTDGSGQSAPDPTVPIPPSLEPIVFEHERPRGEPTSEEREASEEEAGHQAKWVLASRYASAGYDDEALQLIDAALAGDPPAEWATRLRQLKQSIRMRRVEEGVLRVDVLPDREFVGFDEDLRIRLRLRNVSAAPVVLPPPESAEVSRSAVVLELDRRDVDVGVGELTRRWTQTLFLHRDDRAIRIPPGGVFEVPAVVPGSEIGGALPGLRVLEIGGLLRPTRVRVGDAEQAATIRIRPARVTVLPRGYEPLAEAPLRSMELALRSVAPVHLLVAAEFLAPADEPAGMEILARTIRSGPSALWPASAAATRRLHARSVGRPLVARLTPWMAILSDDAVSDERAERAMEVLSEFTGADLAPRRGVWLLWWGRIRDRDVRVPPLREAEVVSTRTD